MSETSLENAENRLSKREIAFVAELGIVSISRMFGLFMVLPVLALWASDLNDATPLLVGIAVGGYGVTQALLQIPYGALSDRIGRGPVIAFGLAVFLLGSVIAASADSIGGLIVGRLLQGAGAISATLSAWLADHTRESVRTMAMGIFGAAIGGSFLLALVMGPLLATWLGVRGLFWVSAGLAAFAVTLTFHAMRSRPSEPRRRRRVVWQWKRLLRAELISLDLAILVLHAALTGFFVLAPNVLIDRVGLPDSEHWKVYTITLAASLPVAIPLIARDGRQRSGQYVSVSLLMMVMGFAVIGFSAASLLGFGIGCTLFFAGFSYLEASLPALMSLRADADQRGACLGLFSSAQFFGAFVGATGAGWIVGVGSATTGVWAMTGLLASWLLLNLLNRTKLAS